MPRWNIPLADLIIDPIYSNEEKSNDVLSTRDLQQNVTNSNSKSNVFTHYIATNVSSDFDFTRIHIPSASPTNIPSDLQQNETNSINSRGNFTHYFATNISSDADFTRIHIPSVPPTNIPSFSKTPSTHPFLLPSSSPLLVPSLETSKIPSVSVSPSSIPSTNPTSIPTLKVSVIPSFLPSTSPLFTPSIIPSAEPSVSSSLSPTKEPSSLPSIQPSTIPSTSPSVFRIPVVQKNEIKSCDIRDFREHTSPPPQYQITYDYELILSDSVTDIPLVMKSLEEAILNDLAAHFLKCDGDNDGRMLKLFQKERYLQNIFNQTSSSSTLMTGDNTTTPVTTTGNILQIESTPEDVPDVDQVFCSETTLTSIASDKENELFCMPFKGRMTYYSTSCLLEEEKEACVWNETQMFLNTIEIGCQRDLYAQSDPSIEKVLFIGKQTHVQTVVVENDEDTKIAPAPSPVQVTLGGFSIFFIIASIIAILAAVRAYRTKDKKENGLLDEESQRNNDENDYSEGNEEVIESEKMQNKDEESNTILNNSNDKQNDRRRKKMKKMASGYLVKYEMAQQRISKFYQSHKI